MPVLFLKAGAPRKIAGQAGYVKINGRWHKAGADIKAPKGAPKAAHPHAAGKHKPYQLPEADAAKLKYDPEKAAKNHEMKGFNEKHLPNLLAHAAKGDATAILGHKYGTNTHAKKLVAIANHLLEQMGSPHKVTTGQAAGAHEAVSKAPTEEQAEAVAKDAIEQVADNIQAQPEPPAEPASPAAEKTSPATGALQMPQFISGKQSKGVRTAYEAHAQKIIDAVEASDITALQALVNPTAGSWKGKTANSKMLLNMYGQALAKLQGKGERPQPVAEEASPVAAIETIASIPAQPKPTVKGSPVTDIDWAAFVVPDNIKSSKGYNKQLENIQKAAEAGDVYAIVSAKYGTNTYGKKIAAAANLALTKMGHPDVKVVLGKDAVHPLVADMPQPDAEEKQAEKVSEQVAAKREDGPKNGDTRMGKDGMLVFQDGRWHKQGTDEEATDKEAAAKLKTGSKVTFHQMAEVPPGSIVQCYTKDGKPGQKFLIGHGHAWYIPPSGKPWKTPLKPGQYKGLMGLDTGYYPGETGHDYIGGYHSLEHPTTIDKVGKDVWYSDKAKAAVKAYFPGAEAAYNPGVYPAMGGKYLIVGDPAQPAKAFAVKENGDPVNLMIIAASYTDPVMYDFMKGKDPGNNIAARLGLVAEKPQTLSQAPFHPDDTVAKQLASISDSIAAGEFYAASGIINELADAMKTQEGTAESLNVMKWLITAKATAIGGISQVKAEIPNAPAPKPEPQKMAQMPDFENSQAFNDWANSPDGAAWAEQGEIHYGSAEAFAASAEGQAWDTWSGKHDQYLKRQEAKKEKAKKAAGASLAGVFENASTNLDTLMAIEDFVALKGDTAKTYEEVVKAAGDGIQHITVLKSALKGSINMHGVPKGMPKAKYTGESMADADALDGLTAMAMMASYTESPEMKEAILNDVKEAAYAYTAMGSGDIHKMEMADHAVQVMIHVQDTIQGKEPIAPIKEKSPNADVQYLNDIEDVVKNATTTATKIFKAGAVSKAYYDAAADKVDAVATIKSILMVNDYSDAHIEAILKHVAQELVAEATAAVENGPKDGDMKPGANGMLILKNGHWVKAGPDEVKAPDWAGLGLTSWQQDYYQEVADHVKKALAAGKLKGVLMQKADGTLLAYHPNGGKCKISTEAGAPGKKALAEYISMQIFAHGGKVKSGWTPANGSYAMAGKVMEADAATSNPAENGMSATGPVEVKKYQWKKKEPISVDSWEVTGGNQGGSNEGMKMKDADGQEWYVKFPGDEEHAKSEVLAAKLYAAAGISAQAAMIVTKGGKLAIASKWEDLKKAKSHSALSKTKGMLEGFAVDAWLGNWDVVGLNKDNVQLKADGTVHRVDAGGSLMYRAQGKKKDFGPEVIELKTLLDPNVNAHSAAVFGGMTDADIAASVTKVLAISDAKIAHMVNQFGPGDDAAKSALVETLIKRKEYLAAQYPEAAKMLKLAKFKPEKISTPPDFLNWSGAGKSGPSSKEFLNKANEDAAQAIYAAAQTGDPDAISALTAPTFNKETGEVTGQVPVLDHPSQHIKGYAMQAINEIKSLVEGHEHEHFRIGGDHPLYSMHEEYKPEHWSGSNTDKIGKLLVLGHPGIVDPADLGLTKTTYKAGTLTMNTYAKAAQDVWSKLPNTQKQAVQAYTGSSYQQMNSGLWKGNPSAEAKAAAQALSGMGHEISPGTTFGRKFSLSSGDMAKLKASVGKVIMEPAIMSTSISPDVWSGNIHLKMTAGPGVKGIYAGAGSLPGGGSISHHTGEKEIILPPNTRLLVTKVVEPGSKDADGFGGNGMTVVECIILPSV
ncbi:hypothetical protein VPZ60_004246 [Salmonella enterica]|nr:hypothetical protein [Salmonella enterica]